VDTLSATEEVQAGAAAALELSTRGIRDLELGVGIEYQAPHEMADRPNEEFNFLPVYGFAKLYARARGSRLFFSGRVGYNFYEGNSDYEDAADLDGGLCYSGGLGVIASGGWELEVSYAVNKGTRDDAVTETEVEYSRVSICLSIVF
jgi:hypothetical protein